MSEIVKIFAGSLVLSAGTATAFYSSKLFGWGFTVHESFAMFTIVCIAFLIGDMIDRDVRK